MNLTTSEIFSQPTVWGQALGLAQRFTTELTAPGERVLALGCGTSWFVAQAFAALREQAGFGTTDAVCASELVWGRDYDRVVAITRSGTTSEVLTALRQVPAGVRRVVVTAVGDQPVGELADAVVLLDFADEASVVQTRFPTTVLALSRACLGEDLRQLVAHGEAALSVPLPADPSKVDQMVFLGTGWRLGLAHEAALKVRESAQAWSESYPANDYRHGPIAVARPGSLVWFFGAPPAGLSQAVAQTGAAVHTDELDPLAQLVLAQRFAVGLAAHRGLDPDAPRALTRSVILPSAA